MNMARDRIDVHAHYIPETYRDALMAAGQAHPDGIPALPDWNQALALGAMDKLHVRLAILSISSPGVHFGDAAAAMALARTVNETGAQIARATPERFGFFATLPLPEIDASVAETRYALDHLGAAGVCLMTNSRGVYLGDQRLAPAFPAPPAHRSPLRARTCRPPRWSSCLRPPARSPIWCSPGCRADIPACGSSCRTPARRCRYWRRGSTCSPPHWRAAGPRCPACAKR